MGQTEQLLVRPFGERADDIIYNIILLKLTDPLNSFLPFMYAHSLELSAKTACLKLDIDYTTLGHPLIDIYKSLSAKVPDIKKYIPTEKHLTDYKKIWVSTEPILKKDIHILNPDEPQPSPDELQQLELAYFMDNVANLKYGVDKKKAYVSIIQLSYQSFNRYFMDLFIMCRNVYTSPTSDNSFETKFFKGFQKTPENVDFINKFLNRKK